MRSSSRFRAGSMMSWKLGVSARSAVTWSLKNVSIVTWSRSSGSDGSPPVETHAQRIGVVVEKAAEAQGRGLFHERRLALRPSGAREHHPRFIESPSRRGRDEKNSAPPEKTEHEPLVVEPGAGPDAKTAIGDRDGRVEKKQILKGRPRVRVARDVENPRVGGLRARFACPKSLPAILSALATNSLLIRAQSHRVCWGSTLEYTPNTPGIMNILEGVGVQQDNVGNFADFDRTQPAICAHRCGRIQCRYPENFEWRHSCVGESGQLLVE